MPAVPGSVSFLPRWSALGRGGGPSAQPAPLGRRVTLAPAAHMIAGAAPPAVMRLLLVTLSAFICAHPAGLRLSGFLGVFALMALWELLAPRRLARTPTGIRWMNNLGLIVLDTLLVRLVLPAAALATALLAVTHGWGVLHRLALAPALAVPIAVVALDLTIYLQHVMLHAVPTLWRLHRVHHADLDIDVTTGVRFHPFEMALSVLVKCAAIVLIGASPAAVVIFEVLLNASSLFTHGNVRLPAAAERVLRLVLVTPEMHRIHHSIEDDETNSNFGFNLSCWDRLFGTYRAAARAAQQEMPIGIRTFREARLCAWLPGMLAMPFVGRVTDYALNRRPSRAGP